METGGIPIGTLILTANKIITGGIPTGTLISRANKIVQQRSQC